MNKRKMTRAWFVGLLLSCAAILTACSVHYSFNGSNIDYSVIKTIQIADFPIRSSYVWGPMGPLFNNQLRDHYANHTKTDTKFIDY